MVGFNNHTHNHFMKKDYVKAKKISERLTGEPFKVRQTSKKFQQVIEDCNNAVESILSKTELTEKEKEQANKIGL